MPAVTTCCLCRRPAVCIVHDPECRPAAYCAACGTDKVRQLHGDAPEMHRERPLLDPAPARDAALRRAARRAPGDTTTGTGLMGLEVRHGAA